MLYSITFSESLRSFSGEDFLGNIEVFVIIVFLAVATPVIVTLVITFILALVITLAFPAGFEASGASRARSPLTARMTTGSRGSMLGEESNSRLKLLVAIKPSPLVR
eukprot:m.184475 g.184475  ORF g.184475 m.184475 type:complete len:107 (+) comp53522_c0_seq3:2549-2869(+)